MGRPPSAYRGPWRALAITRSGAGVDLPGFGRGRSDMSDREDDAPLLVVLSAAARAALRDAYHKVLDDLDDNKDLSFALIQDACARQFRRRPDDDRCDCPDTPRRNKGHQGVVRTALNKEFPHPKPGEVSAFLFLQLPPRPWCQSSL